jgi:PKD repeat protein
MGKKIIIVIFVAVIILISLFSMLVYVVHISDNKEEENHLRVRIITDVASGSVPLHVNFKPLILYSQGDVEYYWKFGDGGTSKESNPAYIYREIGTYNCTLTVTDETGRKSSDAVNIKVLKNNPPFVEIIVNKASGNHPMTVNFDAHCFDVDGEIISYEWEIIYPPFFSYQKVINHNEKNFSEKFWRPGFYEVKLIVTDDFDNKVTKYIKIQVHRSKIEQTIQGLVFTRNQLLGLKEMLSRSIDTLERIWNIIQDWGKNGAV